MADDSDAPSRDVLWSPRNQDDPADATWAVRLLDQYKIYVEMADRISQRRAAASSYFLGVNTAVLALAGYVTTQDGRNELWILALAGLVLAVLWWVIIRSYRHLNTAKYLVIHALEAKLPARPYDAEWELLDRGRSARRYLPLSHIESGVPWLFFLLHLLVLSRTVPWPRAG